MDTQSLTRLLLDYQSREAYMSLCLISVHFTQKQKLSTTPTGYGDPKERLSD